VCGLQSVKRLFTGCSINTRSGIDQHPEKPHFNLFDVIRAFNRHVTSNFD